MKVKLVIAFLLLVGITGYALSRRNNHRFKEGDIIFQTSQSGQSKAIQLATHSPLSHCGIICKKGNAVFVFEAVEPVKLTPVKQWIARGKDAKYEVMRLKKPLNPEVLARIKSVEDKYTGKHYDIYFDWSDDNIYCSELIWKVYKEATGLEIGKLQQLKDFDLSSDAVKKKMQERYGNHIPLEENVISPVSIYNSPLLKRVD